MEREVPEGIKNRLCIWRMQEVMLRILLALLGLTAVVASVTVASRLVDVSSNTMSWIAWIAAVSSGIFVSFHLVYKSNNATMAWRTLNTAVQRYKNEDDFTMKDLDEALKTGEEQMGHVEITLS